MNVTLICIPGGATTIQTQCRSSSYIPSLFLSMDLIVPVGDVNIPPQVILEMYVDHVVMKIGDATLFLTVVMDIVSVKCKICVLRFQ